MFCWFSAAEVISGARIVSALNTTKEVRDDNNKKDNKIIVCCVPAFSVFSVVTTSSTFSFLFFSVCASKLASVWIASVSIARGYMWTLTSWPSNALAVCDLHRAVSAVSEHVTHMPTMCVLVHEVLPGRLAPKRPSPRQ